MELKPPRRTRLLTILLVAVLHVAAFIGLLHAFAPDFTQSVIDRAESVLTVTVTTQARPPEPPPPAPTPTPDAGAAGNPGRKAEARETASPKARLPISPKPAPPMASTGNDNASGAAIDGAGTGAAGQGQGTGSGQSGSGSGSGVVRQPEKIAGDINSAKDYARATRDLRIGGSVTIVLAIGTDGRAKSCRVARASPDGQADAITCRLAIERFRFRPAQDRDGNPVEGRYAWRQRWYY